MLRKVIVVYNPRSSQAKVIEQGVLVSARNLRGWLVGKYEVKPASIEENATELARILNDGDLVIVAGGDGTANAALNGVIKSGKDVCFSALGYGNFNDMARLLKTKRPVKYGDEYIGGITEIIERYEAEKIGQLYPLEVKIDGEHWRYAGCYVTLGLFAESTAVFEQKKVRQKLREKQGSVWFSIWQLAKWYFQHRKAEFLPINELRQIGNEGLAVHPDEKTTDYLAVNSPRVAKLMRGRKYYRQEEVFLSATARLGGFFSLIWFMIRSMIWRIPGVKTEKDILTFKKDARVMIQAEGEFQELTGVRKIEVEKVKKPIKIIGQVS